MIEHCSLLLKHGGDGKKEKHAKLLKLYEKAVNLYQIYLPVSSRLCPGNSLTFNFAHL